MTFEVIAPRKTEERRAHLLKCLQKIDIQNMVSEKRNGRILTVAISTRIPFGRFLKVGGKSENIAKLIVCPEAAAPSTVTVNRLVRALAEVVGVMVTVICFQVVWLPERVAVADPKTWPVEDCRPMVTLPLKEELAGNR